MNDSISLSLSIYKAVGFDILIISHISFLVIIHGNIKDVQGDTGHASASMVTDVYGHILDERRKENAKLFEQSFYQQPIAKPEQSDSGNNNKIDTAELLRIIQESPELKEALRELLNEPYLADRHE